MIVDSTVLYCTVLYLASLAQQYLPLMEAIYCNVIYTGKMGTALIPKVSGGGVI